MAINDGTGPDDEAVEGSWSPRRPKAARKASTKPDVSTDPDALAGDIEKTREELAETLDAIADRVSPKRVSERTKKKVKDGTSQAADTVKEAAGHAADAVKEGVAAAKQKVGDDSADPAAGPLEPAPTPGALADAADTPVAPAGAEPTPIYTSPAAPPSRLPAVAGAGAALLVLLLVLRRRRR